MENEDEVSAVKKLVDLINKDQLQGFTHHEADMLKNIARVGLGFRMLGPLGSLIKTILTWLFFMAAAWISFKTGLGDFLRDLVNNG